MLAADIYEALSVKVTKHDPRENDKYDTPIKSWQYAKLRCKSTARISHYKFIPKNQFIYKYGTLHPDDFKKIQNNFKQYIQDN